MIYDVKELKEYFEDDCLLPEHGGTSDFKFDPYTEYGLKKEDE